MTNKVDNWGSWAIIGSVAEQSVTFALALGGEEYSPASVRRYLSADTTTFSEALQRYASDLGIALEHRQLILSVAGSVRGGNVRITNGSWFISPDGIASMLRRMPVVINDVAAAAWSTLTLPATKLRPLDEVSKVDRAQSPRMVVIWVGKGLGAACVAHDADGRPFVLDGEAGHMTCPIQGDGELKLLSTVSGAAAPMSYEGAMAALRTALVGSTLAGARSEIAAIRANILARFAGSVALAFGAWDGICLAGPEVDKVVSIGSARAFREELVARKSFRRALAAVPVWVVSDPDLPLKGCLSRLTELQRSRDSGAW